MRIALLDRGPGLAAWAAAPLLAWACGGTTTDSRTRADAPTGGSGPDAGVGSGASMVGRASSGIAGLAGQAGSGDNATASYPGCMRATLEAEPIPVGAGTSVIETEAGTAPFPCEWKIPPVPSGARFDLANVFIIDGSTEQRLNNVGAESQCATVDGAWYFDDPAAPTRVVLCPVTCATLAQLTDPRIGVLFGCPDAKK